MLCVGTANAARLPADYFGAHGNAQPSVLARLAANGVGVERRDASWALAEPVAPVRGRHHYVWRSLDRIVRTLALHGMRFYALLDYTPRWDESVAGDRASPPADPAAYAAYVAAFASRYGERGSFWRANPRLRYLPVEDYEIWNEPNTRTFWDSTGPPSAYFALYEAARLALERVQPAATAVMGGLSDTRSRSALAWLEQLEAEVPGALRDVAAVAIHPYLYNAALIEGLVKALRQLLTSAGASTTPIEVTEFGGAASAISQASWARIVTTVVRNLATSNCGVTRIILYRDQDPYTGRGVVDKYGDYVMYDRSGVATRIAAAYFKGIAEAEAATTVNALCG